MSNLDSSYRFFSDPSGRSDREKGMGLLLLLSLLLAIAAVALALMTQDSAEPLVLIVLALLAVVGVFALFAGAVGILHFGDRAGRGELTRSYADFLSEGLMITAADGRVQYANEAFFHLLDADPTGDAPTIEQAFLGINSVSDNVFRLSRAALRGEPWVEEFCVPASLATVSQDIAPSANRWFRVSVNRLPDDMLNAEDSVQTVWRVAEITNERARQEETYNKLQEAIEYLDHAPGGFFSADENGNIFYMNVTLAQWLGRDLADVTSGELNISDIFPGDSGNLLMRAASVPNSTTQDLEIDLVGADEKTLPVRLLYQVVGSPGQSSQIRTLVLNRSQGSESEETVRAAEVRFARFFHSAPIAIATVDEHGRIGSANSAFSHMFNSGAGLQVIQGISIFDLVGQEDREELGRNLASANEGQIVKTPVEITLGMDTERNGRLYVSPIDRAAGDNEAAILYAIDTTEQKALEVQIGQSQKMQAVGQLAGGIAHDFNNVLTAIIGFSDLLLANHRPTDPAFKDIMNIKQNANRAASLVRQLLAFSRQQTLRPEVLTMTDVISDLSILLGRLLGEKVDLKVVHGRDLWFVQADVTQFQQVIVNLCVNARDAMPEGGELTINTRNVNEREIRNLNLPHVIPGEYVLLEVRDTGTGIPEAIVEKIFDPFFSTKEVGKGTGLGLSTVYGIVKQTGGYIYPDSEEGKGTVFRIYLPRHVVEEDDSPVEEKVKKPEKPKDLTGSGCVLLVEDEEAVRSFAARALTARGYTVLEAGSGVEALEVMEENNGHVDLVVSDVVMPEMDGPTLLTELRKTNPDMKIIFISGYAEEAFNKNLNEDEKFAFLPKPFSLKQLAAAVKDTLAE